MDIMWIVIDVQKHTERRYFWGNFSQGTNFNQNNQSEHQACSLQHFKSIRTCPKETRVHPKRTPD